MLHSIAVSLIVTRVATVALMLTGLSRESARFQARSAFTGVGYTTTEAESIVNHPVRRRIAMVLMLLGNIGVATVVATVMLSFLQTEGSEHWQLNLALLLAGLVGIWIFSSSKWVERQLNRVIAWSLKRFARLDVRRLAHRQIAEGVATF